MLEVCIHQIKDNFKNLKFLISFILIIMLMILNGVVFSLRMEKKGDEYNTLINSYEQKIQEAAGNLNSIAFLNHLALKKPLVSEFIVEGKQNKFPDVYYINVKEISLPEKKFFYNKRLVHLPPLDWVFIVSLIISFLIFILTYDAVSGEKEKGTLQLVFANSITKIEFILGKLSGISLSIMLPVFVGVVLNILIVISIGKFPMSVTLMLQILIFLFYSLIYILFFVSLGLFISSNTQGSLKSLIWLSLIWIIMVIIVPIVSKISIANFYRVPKITEVNENLKSIDGNLGDLYAKYQAGERGIQYGKVDNYRLERNSAKAKTELANEKQKIIDNYLTKNLNQAKYYYNLNNISPVYLFQSSIERLFDTGIGRDIRMKEQTKVYQDQLMDFIQHVDTKDNASPHIYFLFNYISQNGVDYTLIPRFKEDTSGVFQTFKNSMSVFSILLIEFLIITTIICFTFQRMRFV